MRNHCHARPQDTYSAHKCSGNRICTIKGDLLPLACNYTTIVDKKAATQQLQQRHRLTFESDSERQHVWHLEWDTLLDARFTVPQKPHVRETSVVCGAALTSLAVAAVETLS